MGAKAPNQTLLMAEPTVAVREYKAAHGDSKESAMLISHFINHVFAANVVACCDSLKSELGQ